MHYYTFYAKDYASKTSFLEPMEDLAYRRMLDLYYLDEKPLSCDIEEIALLIRMRSHCDCIATVLRYFFDLTASGYINKKVEFAIDDYHAKSVKAKASADARWAKVKAEKNKKPSKNSKLDIQSESNANALNSQCEMDANYKQETINHKLVTNKDIGAQDKPSRFMFAKELGNLGGDKAVIAEYMAHRKSKKASNSKIAFDGLIREQQKSGLSLDDVMRMCIERAWRGFESKWVENQNQLAFGSSYAQRKENSRPPDIGEYMKTMGNDFLDVTPKQHFLEHEQ